MSLYKSHYMVDAVAFRAKMSFIYCGDQIYGGTRKRHTRIK